MKRIWQIAYPEPFKNNPHLAGLNHFLDRFIEQINQSGDAAIPFPFLHIPSTPHGPTLNFHTHGWAPNSYHYKESFLKDWVQIDTHGYTGWHSCNTNPALMPVAEARLDRIRTKLTSYVASQNSKYEQAARDTRIPSTPYLFFPLQKPQDETSLFARFSPQDIVAAVLPWCAAHNYTLVIKRHPFCHSAPMAEWLQSLHGTPHLHITEGNVINLIDDAAAVLTVNSSVGFESILRQRPVLTFGKAEYSSFTHEIMDLKNIATVLDAAAGTKPAVPDGLYHFAAASLYDINDPADYADLYNALCQHYDHYNPVALRLPAGIPAHIDFSERGNSDVHCLHGFSYAEAWGRWTNDHTSTFIFHHDGTQPIMGQITINVRGYIVDRHPDQGYSLYFNNQFVGRSSCTHDNNNQTITLNGMFKPGMNMISFVNHSPIRPGNYATDFDVRLLGLGFLSFHWQQA